MDDDARLRALYADSDPEEHPDETEWEALALDELDAERRSALLEHALDCSSCARALRGVNALDEGRRRLGAPGRARWWVLLPVAAAASVLLLLNLPAILPPSPAEVRSDGDASRPQPTEPLGELTGPPAVLRWQPSEETRTFRVEILDAAGAILWKSGELSETSCPWPSDLRVEAGRYYWRVVGFDEDGEPIASPMVSFEVSAP